MKNRKSKMNPIFTKAQVTRNLLMFITNQLSLTTKVQAKLVKTLSELKTMESTYLRA